MCRVNLDAEGCPFGNLGTMSAPIYPIRNAILIPPENEMFVRSDADPDLFQDYEQQLERLGGANGS